jgi:trimeric autotransporter adhesin
MHPPRTSRGFRSARPAAASLATVLALLLPPAAAWAVTPKQPVGDLDQKAFFKPELAIASSDVPLASIQPRLPNRAAWDSFFQARAQASAAPRHVFIDPRSGAVTNIIGSFPLIPGSGVGNSQSLATLSQSLGMPVTAVDADVVARAARRFVMAHRAVLGIDVGQLGPFTAVQMNPELWQVSAPQQVGGVPVRYGRLLATISHGNLVVIGTETWGDVSLDLTPALEAETAVDAGFTFLAGRTLADVMVRAPHLEVVPVAPAAQVGAYAGAVGGGYGHRLAWSFVFQRQPELANWEMTVDAHTGELLALKDVNHYAAQQIKGGVYPLTSTGICNNDAQCGAMQGGWPMPFANTGLAAPNNFTNSAGLFDFTSGTATTTLTGRYVRIVDSCGALSASSGTGAIELGGVNNQHDCTIGTGGGAGNTAASRSAFYEVNKLAEQARGWLPTNTWLQNQLRSNVNLNQTCNAFWDPGGGTINFYRSGGGCRNTGEIAAVFDHEWGHGMDDNDAAGGFSNSSEAYADVAALYRLQSSCVGFGFFQTINDGCGQTADGTGFNTNEALTGAAYCATDCSGVRDADFAKHNPATPATPLGFVCGQCTAGDGPCGRQTHCSAAPVRQAAWDFVNRDLTAAPFSLDSQSAYIVGNRVFYQGSGNIGAWHSCTCGVSATGCAAANGYMQWLTVDDDNGNLNDGTPHMTAIFNAFNRHGIACSAPAAVNSGCAAGPAGPVSNLTATPGNNQVSLAWSAAAGATRYWVFRSEGHAGCDFGKTLIATVTTLSHVDTQVANGREYYYNVVPAGASSSCYGKAGACLSVTPAPAVTPDFTLTCSPASLTVQQGGTGASTCTLGSVNDFNGAVSLGCSGLPAGATCGFVPNPATPPAGGSTNSALTITVPGGTATGIFTVQVQGASGALSHSAPITLTVTQAPVPDFSIACNPPGLTAAQGGAASSSCTVTAINGFAGSVGLDCANLPAGVTCGYNPGAVTPTASSALTVSVAASAVPGNYTFQARGTSGALVRTAPLSLFVTGTGGGIQTAVFDAALQAPKCGTVGSSCDSGASLLLGRDGRGPEPNQPNTIADSCADGTSGTFHSDESNDRLKVSTVDGTDFAAGKQVRIEATVWAWTTPSSDSLDLYTAPDANSPVWTLLTTLTPTVAGAQTLSATYTLQSGGSLQAVRAQFRYQSSSANCAAGGYNDRDDLVFAVAGGTQPPPDVTATFDTGLQAPRCASVGRSCDSGPALLLGRDGRGPEPNQPNTIADSCTDGTSGAFHSDESNDRLKVLTTDGTALAAGKQVRIEATVWAWSTPSADSLDLYYAANANAPVWTFIGTVKPTAGGTNTLSATYTLPTGALQAVRANFRYQGAASSCSPGTYDDHDDLVFPVN